MSGLEVAGLISTIVLAFTGAGTLFQNLRYRRQDRKIHAKNESMDLLLRASGPDVQHRCDNDFRALGPVFARGDGGFLSSLIRTSRAVTDISPTTGIGRNALTEQLIILQQTVISLLTQNTSP
jgi:hypothetical protein